jgi:SAM-dependent methyltransferase
MMLETNSRVVRLLEAICVGLRFNILPIKPYLIWRQLFRTNRTLLSHTSAIALAGLAASVERLKIPGCIVDVGCWKGGSTAILAKFAPSRIIYAFDSFEGLPTPTSKDRKRAFEWEGRLKANEEDVRQTLLAICGDLSRCRIIQGKFEETLEKTQTGPIALLHIDADWYRSVATALEVLFPRVSMGGIVIIDDYGEWQGAMLATNEFLDRLDPRPDLRPIDFSSRYFRKETNL